MLTLNLKKLFIQNFKTYKEKEITFTGKDDFYGLNGAGKTSIKEALQLCFFGSSKDTDKIRIGKNEANVTSVFESEDKDEVVASVKLSKQNGYKVKLFINGKQQKSPSKLLREMLGLESFNPSVLLEPKDRVERLLKMIPITIKKEDVKIDLPEGCEINYDEHGFDVLSKIQSALFRERTYLYREKKSKASAFFEFDQKVSKQIAEFQDKHQVSYMNYKTQNLDQKMQDAYNYLALKTQDLADAQEELNKAKRKMDVIKADMNMQRVIDDKVNNIKSQRKFSEELRQSFENSYEKHTKIDDYIKVGLSDLKKKLLKPITQHIPGLSLTEDNDLLLDNKSIDELSYSESKMLGIKFIKIKNKNSIIIVDNAESIDEDNINKIDWGKLSVILLRVSSKPLENKDFKSTKVEKKHENNKQ